MAAVKNGAELIRRLKATGTPDQRLAPGREALKRIRDERKEVANSAQVIAALEEAYGPTHMTVVKAKAIAANGEWVRPVEAKPIVAIEEELLETVEGEDAAPLSEALPEKRKGVVKPHKSQKAIRTTEIVGVEPVEVIK